MLNNYIIQQAAIHWWTGQRGHKLGRVSHDSSFNVLAVGDTVSHDSSFSVRRAAETVSHDTEFAVRAQDQVTN